MDARTRLLLLTDPYAGYRRTEAMTLSGNEITDASRAAGLEGDGLLNDSSVGIWAATTNLCTNGGFETNTTGWTTGGTNTLASSSARAKFGAKSGLATYQNNATLADFGVTITNVAHTVSAWIYIPTAYDGAGVELRQTGFTVAASAVAASMGTRDAWQKVSLTFTPGADVTGNIQVNNTGAAPTAGRDIGIDGFQIEAQVVATPYVETDGGTASRSAALVHASPRLISGTQGWVAMRTRMGCESSIPGTSVTFASLGTDGANYISLFRSGGATQSIGRIGGGAGYAQSNFNASAWSTGDILTEIFKWTATGLTGSRDGAAFPAETAQTTVPAITDFVIGAWFISPYDVRLHGDILWFACGTGTLTDAQASILHAMGNRPDYHALRRMGATGIWDCREPAVLRY